MEGIRAQDVAAILTSVAAYGGQLAAVFHNYSLIADRIPGGFEGAINILDATVTTLKQVLALLNDEAGSNGKKLFSEEGIKYVHLLALECATTLAKVEPAIEEACLERKERKALQKQKRKASYKKKKLDTVLDPLSLSLDEKEFLEKIEKAKWSWASDDIEKCMERLYDLQLHLLLVFQVVTVGVLSSDVSAGKVDIQSIVTYHERINRTADLVGIKAPPGRTSNARKIRRRGSFSDSMSSDFDSSSDSDTSSIVSYKPRPRSRIRGCGPPPPPPPPPPGMRAPRAGCFSSPPPPPRSRSPIIIIEDSPPPMIVPPAPTTLRTSPPVAYPGEPHPPAYSESSKSETTGPNTASSALLGTMTPGTSVLSSSSKTEKPVYSDEKSGAKKEESVELKKPEEPVVPEARLFKSNSNGFGFKFKSFFRSKESLAAEMRRVLSDNESQLRAFVVQRHITKQIPHSAFHSLEATHMKTILSQLHDDTWYKTFSTLDSLEHNAMHTIIHPYAQGKIHERELIVLKVLQQNKLNAWMVLLSEILRNQPFPRGGTGRILLAICREKLVDGKPLPSIAMGPVGPPPPPPPMLPPAERRFSPRNIRHPPTPYNPLYNGKIVDLKYPPPPPPPPPPPGGFDSYRPPSAYQGPRPGPGPLLPRPYSGPGSRATSIRVSDTTPLTDYDAKETLTTYNEYTVRVAEPTQPNEPRSWTRVVITQESAERHLIQQRVQQFEERDGNVIETKLRMTEQQSGQVTRIMDEIKSGERDSRFEWCWVEISLHNQNGEITDFIPRGPNNFVLTANVLHLIAKRTPRPQYKALDVYNSLVRPTPNPGPRPGDGGPPPGVVRLPPKPIVKSNGRYVSDSDSRSDSDSTIWSSDSSVGNVRRRLRRYKAKKERKANRRRGYYNSEEDMTDSEDEEQEEAIKIKVVLKRGDDVVKKLLELWTGEGKGKGKVA